MSKNHGKVFLYFFFNLQYEEVSPSLYIVQHHTKMCVYVCVLYSGHHRCVPVTLSTLVTCVVSELVLLVDTLLHLVRCSSDLGLVLQLLWTEISF